MLACENYPDSTDCDQESNYANANEDVHRRIKSHSRPKATRSATNRFV